MHTTSDWEGGNTQLHGEQTYKEWTRATTHGFSNYHAIPSLAWATSMAMGTEGPRQTLDSNQQLWHERGCSFQRRCINGPHQRIFFVALQGQADSPRERINNVHKIISSHLRQSNHIDRPWIPDASSEMPQNLTTDYARLCNLVPPVSNKGSTASWTVDRGPTSPRWQIGYPPCPKKYIRDRLRVMPAHWPMPTPKSIPRPLSVAACGNSTISTSHCT